MSFHRKRGREMARNSNLRDNREMHFSMSLKVKEGEQTSLRIARTYAVSK